MAKGKKSDRAQVENVESVRSQEKKHMQEKEQTKEHMVVTTRPEESKKEEKQSVPTAKKELKSNEPDKPFKTSFEKWIESSLFDQQAKEDGSTINLGLEGLTNAHKVKKFLLSPAGKEVVAEIGAQLALKRDIDIQQQQERQEHELFKRRLMAALLSWYLSKKSDAAQKVKELIHQQNEKAIKDAGKTSTPTSQSTSQPNKDFQKMLDDYDKAIRRAQENIAKGEELERKLDKLERQGQDIEEKYNIYDESLNEFDSLLTDSETLLPSEIEERMDFLTKDSDKLMQLMDKHKDDEKTVQSLKNEHHGLTLKLANLRVLHEAHSGTRSFVNDKGEPVNSLKEAQLIINNNQEVVQDSNGFYLIEKGQWDTIKDNPEARAKAQNDYTQAKHDLVAIKLDALIHKLSLQMEKQLEEINDLISSPDPKDNEKATKMLHQHNGLNLKLANLHDMLSVHRKEKSFVNDKGEEVSSLSDAHYVIGKDQQLFDIGGTLYPIHKEQKVLEKDGKFYLLKQDENWESIKESPEKQKQAEHAFDKLKYETPMTVKKLVHHNKGLETTFHKEQVEQTKQELKVNEHEKMEISNSISKLQSTISIAQSQLNQPDLNQESVTLAPSGGSTKLSPKPGPSLAAVTTFFRAKIQEMKEMNSPGLTRDELRQFQNQIPEGAARNYFTSALTQMPRTGPVPFQIMQAMLRNLEKFGVDTTKPSVTSIRSKTDEVVEQRFNPTPTSLTPFKSS